MPRKPRASRSCSASTARWSTSTARWRRRSRAARSIWQRLVYRSISGKPRWPSSRSISRITGRTNGSWSVTAKFSTVVMAGLVPGIHVFLRLFAKTWMAGTSPALTSVSTPQPLRRAFLGERLGPLDVVLRSRHRFYGRIVALVGHRLLQRDFHAHADRLLGGADRHRRVLGDGLGPALGCGECAARGRNLVDEAELETFPGRDVARSQDHAHGALQPD